MMKTRQVSTVCPWATFLLKLAVKHLNPTHLPLSASNLSPLLSLYAPRRQPPHLRPNPPQTEPFFRTRAKSEPKQGKNRAKTGEKTEQKQSMSIYDAPFLNSELSKPTSIFGLRLWIVIGILVGSGIVLFLFLLSLCLTTSRRHKHRTHERHSLQSTELTSPISKDIQEINTHNQNNFNQRPIGVPEIQIDIGKVEHRVVFSDKQVSSGESLRSGNNVGEGSNGVVGTMAAATAVGCGPEVSHLGWGRWYTLRELEEATNGLGEENVIGEGGYGIVYSGVLSDGTRVAVKNLLNNKYD